MRAPRLMMVPLVSWVLRLSRYHHPLQWAVGRGPPIRRLALGRWRFRSTQDGSRIRAAAHDNHDALRRAEQCISKIAKTKQAWQRLSPLVELALLAVHRQQRPISQQHEKNLTSVADIGTDHGLLAFGLAASGLFDTVVGVDVSERALRDGAFASWNRLRELQVEPPSYLQFQVGDGLQGLQTGQADVVCLAGMGVNTMRDILDARHAQQQQQHVPVLWLDHLHTRVLLVQPTNTRPRNLIALYQHAYQRGFVARHERLVTLAGRWYLSTALVRVDDDDDEEEKAPRWPLPVEEFPLTRLSRDNDVSSEQPCDDDNDLLQGYLAHHIPWLQDEAQKAGKLRGREDEWLDKFESLWDGG